MRQQGIRLKSLVCSICAVSGFFIMASADLTEQYKQATNAKIDTLRKRNCAITILNKQGQPASQVKMTIKQINHSFGFGASVCWDSGFVKIGKDKYGDLVKKYFEWVTPENEMKWYYNDTTGGQPCAPGFYNDADSLVDWCLANGVKIRGHNLFWNERVEFQAYCARPYGPYDAKDSSRLIKSLTADQQTAFIGEMETRIHDLVTRYKGKVKHWDAINEIVHFTTDNNGAREIKVPGLLATWTNKKGNGGAEVFNWVMDTARAFDPDVKMCVNEYNTIEQSHQEADYITMIKNINSGAGANAKIDIIGLEGHFGGLVSRTQSGSYSGYESLVNTIATGVTIKNTAMKFWFTEIDWNQTGNTADKMEELLRFAYSREDFGGMLLWIWWGGRLWRDDLVSFLVDKDLNETETGARWRGLVKDTWMTKEFADTSDANGRCTFRGFQGDYRITMTVDAVAIDTVFTLGPGTDTLKWQIIANPVSINRVLNNTITNRICINGTTLNFNRLSSETEPLFISVFSLSGKLVMRKSIDPLRSKVITMSLPAGCHLYRIGTEKVVFHTAMGLNLH
jgi:endo-1,4-beta-xylanase